VKIKHVCHGISTLLFSGINCDIDDPCVENKTCPVGSLCYGTCEPNVICEAATGTAHCRGCVAGWTGLHCEVDVDECKGASGQFNSVTC
jgi:hypothetical protein